MYTHSTPRCVRYSDKLPMKITCNCWNNSLWNYLSARPGKQMSLEFPGIISLQIQVTTKDFESWIHYWTIPLNMNWSIYNPCKFPSLHTSHLLYRFVTCSENIYAAVTDMVELFPEVSLKFLQYRFYRMSGTVLNCLFRICNEYWVCQK